MKSRCKWIEPKENYIISQSDIKRFFKKINIVHTGCWEWQASICQGYGHFGLNYKIIKAHRFSYMIFIGELEPDLDVMHSCDNRRCVNPFHLSKGTNADNMRDMVIKGRSNIGEKNFKAKLIEQQVIEIRNNTNLSYLQLSEIYNVDRRQISKIIRLKAWTNLIS